MATILPLLPLPPPLLLLLLLPGLQSIQASARGKAGSRMS
jgi:hypothetical protein